MSKEVDKLARVIPTHGGASLFIDMFSTYSRYGQYLVGRAKDTEKPFILLLNVPRATKENV